MPPSAHGRLAYFSVCWGKPSDAPPKARQEHSNQRHFDERFAGLHLALVVLRQPAVARQPREATFDHPPARLHLESTGAPLALHDLEVPTAVLLAPVR